MSSKRKAASSQRENSYGDDRVDYDSDGPINVSRKGSYKPGESTVTKRTLQNRKSFLTMHLIYEI